MKKNLLSGSVAALFLLGAGAPALAQTSPTATTSSRPPKAAVPELDASLLVAGLTLLGGGWLVAAGRRRRSKQ